MGDDHVQKLFVTRNDLHYGWPLNRGLTVMLMFCVSAELVPVMCERGGFPNGSSVIIYEVSNFLLCRIKCSILWLIFIAGLGFGFGLGLLYYTNTMGKRSKSESESVEKCSA